MSDSSGRARFRRQSAGLVCGLLGGLGVASADVTFTDQRDREIRLDGPAERVVTIPIPAASMVIAVDAGTEHLVGMHHLSKAAIKGHILGEFFPEALKIPSNIVGKGFTFVPNIEELLVLQPDLVFQWGHLTDDIIEPIENAGLDVALIKIGREEFTIRWLEIMGKIFDEEDKTDALIRWRHDTREMLEKATGEIPASERPRVLYFMNYLSSLRVAGGKSYNDFTIDLAGGTNVANELGMFADVGAEQIIAWNPEVILLNGFEAKLTPEDVYANPLFADLSAVRNKRVYKMPLGGYRWDPPNQESPLAWLWLSMVLHPDRLDWPLRQMIDERYREMYGRGVDADDIDRILRFPMQRDAASYQVFDRS